MTPPFSAASETEVVTRVLAAYIRMRVRQHPSTLCSWRATKAAIEPVIRQFDGGISMWSVVQAFDVAFREGYTFAAWHTAVIQRARLGYTWRRCLYPDYKLFDDPRVTNRGVMS